MYPVLQQALRLQPIFSLSSLVTRLEDRQVVLAGYLTTALHTVLVNLREYILVHPASAFIS